MRCVRTTLSDGHAVPTDRELLERYLADKDQGAFVSLLKRHGPRVFATCRRALFHDANVEDAFQETFLVLVAKARAVRWQPCWAAG
jgi:DNA-directed RNA polymerase specialized sigma24 family protein